MDKKSTIARNFSKVTIGFLLIGILPMFLIVCGVDFPVILFGKIINNNGGITSGNFPLVSYRLNSYVGIVAPLLSFIAFLTLYRALDLKHKFETNFKLYATFFQYALFVFVIYYLFYFCHLELTEANGLIRGLTNGILGLSLFYTIIVFPAMYFSLLIFFIFLNSIIKNNLS
ncbi:hypothetical protein NG99_12490 [Erwinia typographi]|uniref:Colicin immunity protein n=1 Tax=Erwinia typographi TaxID=371042 RepID=A0A0A3Z2F6_9GAMM|nr:colicin immunity protein Cui [Erwinia typographi]KGT93020.1 hypothetical protein NG99_12490 [Erwinia typographi]